MAMTAGRKGGAAATGKRTRLSPGERRRQLVELGVEILAERPDIDDGDAVTALVQHGVGEIDAELLVRFVPCALTFALLKLMGVKRFPSAFQVQGIDGRWVEMPLAAEHYFSAALGVGYEVTTHGYTERISKETFQSLISRSAEMNAVNQFFEAGHLVAYQRRTDGNASHSGIDQT